MDNLSGQIIKGYKLHEQIAAGGMGAVYRAHQPIVDREVAIKVILPQYANQPDFIRRFEMEAQIIASLEHLHIVPLYDYWRDPEGAYLVMRWQRGGSLRDQLKEGPLELEAAAHILDQVASALDLAHRYVRELTCSERDLYQLEPRCNAAGVFPTSTPYPTRQPTTQPTPVVLPPTFPAIDLPQATMRPILVAHTGEQRGQVTIGDSQLWSYRGQAGETLTVRVNADHPLNGTAVAEGAPTPEGGLLDTWLTITDPDGAVLTTAYVNGMLGYSGDIDPGVNTDSLVEGLVLRRDGTYLIEISGAVYQTSGSYTLIIESAPPEAVTPAPEDTPPGSR